MNTGIFPSALSETLAGNTCCRGRMDLAGQLLFCWFAWSGRGVRRRVSV